MWPYWLLLAFPAFASLRMPLSKLPRRHLSVLIIVYSVFIGLRFEVGGDWYVYKDNLEELIGADLVEAVFNPLGDPGYNLLSWLSNGIGAGIYGVNFFCALIFSCGLLVFCNVQPRPWLALCVSTPYLIIVVAMGYTRQSVAIGLALIAFLYLEKKNIVKFFLGILLATLFHKTALVMLAAALPVMGDVKGALKKIIFFLATILAAVGLIYTFLAPRLDFFIYGYEQQAMQSQGAAIRVAMVIIPSLILIFFQKKFNLQATQKYLWLGLAYLSVGCAVALFLIKSSTIVDRLALYCIPLQGFVAARIADTRIFALAPKRLSLAIVMLAFLVQFVWLNFALTAFAWLPYGNILLEL